MEKQFLVKVDCKENEPSLVTAMAIEVCVENMMDGYKKGLIQDGWSVDVTEINNRGMENE